MHCSCSRLYGPLKDINYTCRSQPITHQTVQATFRRALGRERPRWIPWSGTLRAVHRSAQGRILYSQGGQSLRFEAGSLSASSDCPVRPSIELQLYVSLSTDQAKASASTVCYRTVCVRDTVACPVHGQVIANPLERLTCSCSSAPPVLQCFRRLGPSHAPSS